MFEADQEEEEEEEPFVRDASEGFTFTSALH